MPTAFDTLLEEEEFEALPLDSIPNESSPHMHPGKNMFFQSRINVAVVILFFKEVQEAFRRIDISTVIVAVLESLNDGGPYGLGDHFSVFVVDAVSLRIENGLSIFPFVQTRARFAGYFFDRVSFRTMNPIGSPGDG